MIKEILAYQEEDANLRKIELELSGSEEKKKAVQAKRFLDGVADNVNKLDDLAEQLKKEYDVAIAEQKKLNDQQEEFKKAIETVEDEIGATYLLKKIDELVIKFKELGARVNKISEEMQSIVKEYSSIKAKTKVAQDQYTEFGKKYNELKASKQDEMDAIKAKLEKLAKKVDAGLMEIYLKKRENKIFPIVVQIRGNVCGACNMELSMSELNKLKNGEILEHDQCGRLIYQVEE